MARSIHHLAWEQSRKRDELAQKIQERVRSEKRAKRFRRLLFWGSVFGFGIYHHRSFIEFSDSLERLKKLRDQAKVVSIEELLRRRQELMDQLEENQDLFISGKDKDKEKFKDLHYEKGESMSATQARRLLQDGIAAENSDAATSASDVNATQAQMWDIPTPEELAEMKKQAAPYTHEEIPEHLKSELTNQVPEPTAQKENIANAPYAQPAEAATSLARSQEIKEITQAASFAKSATFAEGMYERVATPPLSIDRDKQEFPDF